MSRRTLSLLALSCALAFLLGACAQEPSQASQDQGGAAPSTDTPVYVPSEEETALAAHVGEVLRTDGAVVSLVYCPTPEFTAAYVEVPDIAQIDERDAFRVLDALIPKGRSIPMQVQFKTLAADGTVKMLAFTLSQEQDTLTLRRFEERATSPSASMPETIWAGEAEIAEDSIARVARGEEELPGYELPAE